MQNKPYLPLAVVVAGSLIAAAIYFGGSSAPKDTRTIAKQNASALAPVSASDHIIGDPNAKVVIVEYSDTECPFCKVFHTTLHQIMDTYKGQSIAWVYRDFPIVELHSRAPKEAEALECAAEQGSNTAFWNYLDKIFATTDSNDSLDPANLPKIAGAIGLDVPSFTTCLSSGKYADTINKDVKAAYELGAQGTPYTFILAGGKKTIIVGAQDFNTVKSVIDPLLK